jgi:hypothetical protein
MTSLQQTAMLGGAASAKTANYTLVSADAGTAISMSNAGATTITVNTALFAAGDTVQITNLGAGVCTVTAGTATVNTSASLALAQYESGTLDFTSTSAAIFIKGAGGAGGGMTLLNSGNTTLSGNTFTISSIPSGYVNLVVQLTDVYASTLSGLLLRLNGDTGSNYTYAQLQQNPAVTSNTAKGEPYFPNVVGYVGTSSSQLDLAFADILITNYLGTTGVGMFARGNAFAATTMRATYTQGIYDNSAAITSLTVLLESTHTFSGGNIYLYGVK